MVLIQRMKHAHSKSRIVFFLAVVAMCGSARGEEARTPGEWQRLGVERFYAGDVHGSVEAFDAFLEARPSELPYHWQRGIALYYTEEFVEGAGQFEAHQTVNGNDIENAAWHFLCLARASDADQARKAMYPKGRDSRVPLSEVYDLYAGTGTVEAVLEAAEASGAPDDERNQLCYAHLYLGLYFEVMGEPKKSLDHIRKAATTYAMPHYMGQVAKVHLQLREGGQPAADDGAGE